MAPQKRKTKLEKCEADGMNASNSRIGAEVVTLNRVSSSSICQDSQNEAIFDVFSKKTAQISGGGVVGQIRGIPADEESSEDSIPTDCSNEIDEDSGDNTQETINVDFDFFSPKEDDFHGLKSLLNTFLDETMWNLSEVVELIVSQANIGTVIKIADDETPIGLLTCLSVERNINAVCMKEIVSFLQIMVSKQHGIASNLEAMVMGSFKGVGLIINERLVNVPFDVTGPMYGALFDEIGQASKQEKWLKYDSFLILTRVYMEGKKKGKHKKPKSHPGDSKSGFIFIRPEDEVFLELCSWSSTSEVSSDSQAAHRAHGMKQLRLLMLVRAESIANFQRQLKKLIEEGG